MSIDKTTSFTKSINQRQTIFRIISFYEFNFIHIFFTNCIFKFYTLLSSLKRSFVDQKAPEIVLLENTGHWMAIEKS